MSKEPTIIELEMDELKEILRRAEVKQFNDKDYETAATVPRRLKYRTSHSSRAMPVRSAAMARFMRRPGPACWCGSPARHP